MKIAYHFNISVDEFRNTNYGIQIFNKVFSTLINTRTLKINSKIFIGDLLIRSLAMDSEPIKNGTNRTFNPQKYLELIYLWMNTENFIWNKFSIESLDIAVNAEIFTFCFENIDLHLAENIHQLLVSYSPYLGAIEVDDTSLIHWELYSNSLIPKFRIMDKKLNIFWDGIIDDSKDIGLCNDMKKMGFERVEFESLQGKYSLFDKYHNYSHARRVAEWKKRCGSLLAFISDDIVNRLSDIAPDIGDKLWAAIKTLEDAETNEQFAQVTASCRRIIEYVSDCIFPPLDETHEGHKLGTNNYKNRLLAFADIESKSHTNIDAIFVGTKVLNEQIEKLLALVNKGVHSEVYRNESRRCLIRTIILLDDILSLNSEPFKIKIEYDKASFKSLIN